MELFLNAGYDINHVAVRHKWHAYGGTALKFAADKSAPIDVVRILLEHGSDPDIPGLLNLTPCLVSKKSVRYQCLG